MAENTTVQSITRDTVHEPRVEGTPAFSCTFAPDYVGCDIPRRFFIELELPKAGFPEMDVQHDDHIRLLDQHDTVTRLDNEARDTGRQRHVRRFYFETRNRPGETQIRFARDADAVVVPVVLWGFEELRQFRAVNGVALPRRYPLHSSLPCLKARQKATAEPGRGGRVRQLQANSRARFDESIDVGRFTAAEVWSMCPDMSAMGSQMEGSPDPIHGDDVYRAGGAHYPYKLTMPTPGNMNSWYAISPIDGRRIPSNDWGAGDYHTGEFVDDGFHGLEYGGRRNHFVAMVGQWRGNLAYGLPHVAADNYISTGEAHFLHLALVGLARLALEHQFLAAMPQHRRSHGLRTKNLRLVDATPLSKAGNSGLLMTGIGTSAHIGRLFDAYDKVLPTISDDHEIIPFLQARGLPIEDSDDLRRFIEESIFLVWVQIALDGQCHVNFPGTEARFVHAVSVLEYPVPDLMDIAYDGRPGYWSNGFVRQLIGDGIHRDGVKFESLGGYNNSGNLAVLRVFEQLEQVLDRHPARFPPDQYPRQSMRRRFLTAAESHIEHAPTQYTRIYLGDAGGLPVFGNPAGLQNDSSPKAVPSKRWFFGDESAEFFEKVYARYQDPKVAWALLNTEGWRPSGAFPFTREQLQTNAAKLPDDWRSRGRLLSGPGISLLRSGVGENERCLYTQYGQITHAGESEMGLFLDAFKTRLITTWGYPKNWDAFYRSWMTNNTGRHFPLVGKSVRDRNAVRLSGVNILNVDTGDIHVSDTRADLLYDQKRRLVDLPIDQSRYNVLDDGWQRRLSALVDAGPEEFYVLDFYRIAGGNEHWRSLNTLDGPCEVTGVHLEPQIGGTLAGRDVPYNDSKWIKANGGDRFGTGFALLYDVHKGRADDTPWTATWHVNGSDEFKIRVTGIGDGSAEINLCEGKDRRGAIDITRKFIVWHHRGTAGQQPLHSQVLSAIEAYRDAPVIQRVTPLPVRGRDERGFAPVACEVRLANRTDYVILSADSDETKHVTLPNGKQMTLKGRIGHVSLSPSGEVLQMSAVAATRLACGDDVISRSEAAFRARIAAVDRDAWAITVAPACRAPQELVGKHVYVERGGYQVGFEVRAAEPAPEGTRLTLNCDPLLYTSVVRGIGDGWLKFRLVPASSLTVRLSFNRTYHGASVIGRSGKRYVVDTVTPDGVRLLRPDATDEQLASEFPVGSSINVCDYAPGDNINVPLALTWGAPQSK